MKSNRIGFVFRFCTTLSFFFLLTGLPLVSSASTYLGLSFGSPTLMGLRGAYNPNGSPWIIQGEYSRQVLYHNRSNGLLTVTRINLQYENLDGTENETSFIHTFYFLGIDYFAGYANQYTPALSLLASEWGGGVKLKITTQFYLSSEMGLLLPTRAEKGFETAGLVLNLAFLFRFGP